MDTPRKNICIPLGTEQGQILFVAVAHDWDDTTKGVPVLVRPGLLASKNTFWVPCRYLAHMAGLKNEAAMWASLVKAASRRGLPLTVGKHYYTVEGSEYPETLRLPKQRAIKPKQIHLINLEALPTLYTCLYTVRRGQKRFDSWYKDLKELGLDNLEAVDVGGSRASLAEGIPPTLRDLIIHPEEKDITPPPAVPKPVVVDLREQAPPVGKTATVTVEGNGQTAGLSAVLNDPDLHTVLRTVIQQNKEAMKGSPLPGAETSQPAPTPLASHIAQMEQRLHQMSHLEARLKVQETQNKAFNKLALRIANALYDYLGETQSTENIEDTEAGPVNYREEINREVAARALWVSKQREATVDRPLTTHERTTIFAGVWQGIDRHFSDTYGKVLKKGSGNNTRLDVAEKEGCLPELLSSVRYVLGLTAHNRVDNGYAI